MNANNVNVLLRNNTGNKDKFSLIESFVIRLKIFKNIFSEIKTSRPNKPEQSYLIIGQRGSGKTTLLYRLKYAIEDDEQLRKWLIPIVFTEEQYNIINLENLWESIAEYLEEFYQWDGIVKEMNNENQRGDYYEEKTFEILQARLKKNNKRLILFIDNINILFKKISEKGQKRLREILTTSPYIRIVGSSTSFFDGIIDYSKPFYEFFKITELQGLSNEETKTLLLKIGEQFNEYDEIKNIVKNNSKRIESLRRLTGGVPRTISYLFQIFLDNANGKAIKDLYQLVDHLTLLYKAELDQLSPQQQKIIDVIAKKWDPISVKEIAQKTRFDSKHISSVLNQLDKNQLIELLPTSKKNHLYRIKERFLNIWYLMRFGKKTDREKVLWLVRFFDAWCNKTELAKRVSLYIDNLKKGTFEDSAALDMGITFISCENIPDDLKFSVYEATKAIFPREMVESLKLSDFELYKSIKEFIKKKDYEKVFDILNEIRDKDNPNFFLYRSWVHQNTNEFYKSSDDLETYYNFDKTPDTALQIGRINESQTKNYDKAIKYYELALNENIFEAAYRLGRIYEKYPDLNKSREYFQIAVKNGIDKAIIALANVYLKEGKFDEVESLRKEAIKNKNKSALNQIGIIYAEYKKYDDAERILTTAVDLGEDDAIINLALLNLRKPKKNKEKAEMLFLEAIKKEILLAYYFLGKFYLVDKKDKTKGERYLTIGSEKGVAEASHLLAHLYDEKGQYQKAENLFLQSFKDGLDLALLCLAESIFINKRNGKKDFILRLFETNQNLIKINSTGITQYSLVLLWNNRIEDSINNFFNNLTIIKNSIEENNEETLEELISSLTQFILLLISKGQFKSVKKIFDNNNVNFKEILKPVYYAFINYKQNEFYDRNLKPGDELKDTVNEIIETIENFKKSYK